MKLLSIAKVCLLSCLLLIGVSYDLGATELPPLLLEAGDQDLRDDLRWLNDQGVIQLSTASWPLSYGAVYHALSSADLTKGDVADRQLVKRLLSAMENRLGPLKAVASASIQSEQLALGGFSVHDCGSSVQSIALSSSTTSFAGTLMFNHLSDPATLKQSSGNLAGSYLATSLFGQTVYIGQLNHWWGPGSDGSLQWSSAATPIAGVGLKRGAEGAPENKYLSFIGPWSYELFLGQLQHDETAPGVRIFGLRVQAQPIHGLEIGLSRMFEWGGSGADASFSSFKDSLLGNGNNESTGGAVSNEVAGFDAQYTGMLFGSPLSVYAQLIGEDEAGKLPSQYIGLVGARYQHRVDGMRVIWTIEAADTESHRLFGFGSGGKTGIAYRHETFYRDGFYHDGMPIAHYLGGDGKSQSAAVVIVPTEEAHGLRYMLRYEHASINESSQTINMMYPLADTIQQVEGTVSGGARLMSYNVKWSLGLTGRHSQQDGNTAGVSGSVAVNF